MGLVTSESFAEDRLTGEAMARDALGTPSVWLHLQRSRPSINY